MTIGRSLQGSATSRRAVSTRVAVLWWPWLLRLCVAALMGPPTLHAQTQSCAWCWTSTMHPTAGHAMHSRFLGHDDM